MFVLFAALTSLMILVIYFDFTSYTIPNWLNGLMLALYPALLLLSNEPIAWQQALIAFGIATVIGFAIFAMKYMGGGDIKLLIVTSLWIGLAEMMEYTLLWAIFGGLLSVVVIIARKYVPYFYKLKDGQQLPRLLRDGEPVPYGLAISAAFLCFLWTGKIAGIAAL